jgi:hypothetical protein
MLIEFFVMLLGGAVAALVVGIKMKKWLLTMFSTIMFLVLALQALKIEIVSGGVTLVFQDVIITYLSWFGSMVSLIFTLVGMVNNIKEKRQEAGQGQYPR